jgi:hypothetical protein
MPEKISIEDMLAAADKMKSLPVESFMGFPVVENPALKSNEVIVMVSSDYMKKLKAQTNEIPSRI